MICNEKTLKQVVLYIQRIIKHSFCNTLYYINLLVQFHSFVPQLLPQPLYRVNKKSCRCSISVYTLWAARRERAKSNDMTVSVRGFQGAQQKKNKKQHSTLPKSSPTSKEQLTHGQELLF